ncbi:MAG: glycosyltransferase family 2 protein [Gemmatimonadaceae bacterium]
MTLADRPALTVVLITPDRFRSVRRTVSHLRAQTARDQMELLIVAPAGVEIDLDDPSVAAAVEGIHTVRVLSVPDISPGGRARGAGVRAARAPVVAFAEDHCFPDRDWAAALIRAHRERWAGVGPVIRNANPETAVSRADLFIGYGRWLAPGHAGTVNYLPGHNSSYKRECLLEFGDALDALLEAETVLQWELRRLGHELYLEPAAAAAHVNFALWRSWMPVQLLNGRLFAATRATRWTLRQRLAFAAAAPLIPLVRFQRALRHAVNAGVPWTVIASTAPVLAIGVVIDGVGQLLGYALGPGDAAVRAAEFEHHRERHVTVSDRLRLGPLVAPREVRALT